MIAVKVIIIFANTMSRNEDPENKKTVKEASKNTVEVKTPSLSPNSKSDVPNNNDDDEEANKRRPRRWESC